MIDEGVVDFSVGGGGLLLSPRIDALLTEVVEVLSMPGVPTCQKTGAFNCKVSYVSFRASIETAV